MKTIKGKTMTDFTIDELIELAEVMGDYLNKPSIDGFFGKGVSDKFRAIAQALKNVEKETERLDFLIGWLSNHDDVQEMPVRDWVDHQDARNAIDELILPQPPKENSGE